MEKNYTKKNTSGAKMFHGGGPSGMVRNIQRARDFRGTMKKLFSYLKPFRFSILVVIIFTIASNVFFVMSPKILGDMTNQIVDDYNNIKKVELENKGTESFLQTGINYDVLGKSALLLIFIYLLSSFFGYIQGWIIAGVSQKVSYNLRKDISEKLNRLPLKYFDSKSHGDVLSRIVNDVDTVSQSLNQSMSQIISAFIMLFGIIVIMFYINWMMAVVAILVIPITVLLVKNILKKSQVHYKKQQDYLGEINGHVEEMYSGHSVMKVFNGEERSIEKFSKLNEKMYNSAWKSQFLTGLMWPIMMVVGNFGFVGVSVLGGVLAIRGVVNIGDILAFVQYMRQFNQPMMQIANTANVLQSTAAAAERVFEFLDEAEEENVAKKKMNKKIKGNVSFENIYFGYENDKLVINNFSAKIKAGQTVAIVGPTGAGKTTLVNLLMRFYDVFDGGIKIDGENINQIQRKDLRKVFAMVLQDTWLFKGTIRENIQYAKRNASFKEIEAATKACYVDQIIKKLPGGYNMEINEEADNISQGEKQLITIARAMLVDPEILILDEATSSVDTRTEVLIQNAMQKLMKNRTSFIIAHRLSTIRNADLILVVRDGQIIEQGDHKTLIANKGFYHSLYTSQFDFSI